MWLCTSGRTDVRWARPPSAFHLFPSGVVDLCVDDCVVRRYNLRNSGGDWTDKYFMAMELIAVGCRCQVPGVYARRSTLVEYH